MHATGPGDKPGAERRFQTVRMRGFLKLSGGRRAARGAPKPSAAGILPAEQDLLQLFHFPAIDGAASIETGPVPQAEDFFQAFVTRREFGGPLDRGERRGRRPKWVDGRGGHRRR